jgi:phosphoribosylformylglycinamidine (FGAM) synthase PurS component
MPQRIEITLKEQLLDAEGQSLCHKAKDYFDIDLHQVRTIQYRYHRCGFDAGSDRNGSERRFLPTR